MNRRKEADPSKESQPGRKPESRKNKPGRKPGSEAGKKTGGGSGKESTGPGRDSRSSDSRNSGRKKRPAGGSSGGYQGRSSAGEGSRGEDRRGGHSSRGEDKRNSRSGESRKGSGGGRDSRQDSDRQKNSRGPAGRGGKTYDRRKPGRQAPRQARQEGNLGGEIRLNKYIAHAGFCSRREADTYIEEGKVWVNGTRVSEHGVKVKPTDEVKVNGQSISLEPFVYILLNKSKDTISTTDDERGRNTVLDAIEDATGYRVYPVGRLDRNTMGLLLLTNDGDLANRLMHPSYKVRKVYELTTSVMLGDEQLIELASGIELEDGPVNPLNVSRDALDPKKSTISVYEGRNHLIRRIAEYFGVSVTRLKRIKYAGLSIGDLRMGRWRYLRAEEVNNLRKLVKLHTLDFNKES